MITTVLGECDCCGKKDAELARVFYCGMETFACDECRGEDDPDTSKDRAAA